MDILRIGIVGFGAWGPNHARTFKAQSGCRLAQIAETSEPRLIMARKQYPEVEITNDAEAVLEGPGNDAVVIATPLESHHNLVRRALLAGKHVLCEKPLTRTSEEAKELIQIADSKNLVLMVGHVFMFNPGVLFLKTEIERGELGRIYYLGLVRTNLGPIRQDVGAIYDLASHDISICNFLLENQPDEVACNAGYYLQRDREDVAFLTLYYPNQVVANIHVSWLDPRKVRQMTVVGNSKMALWDDVSMTEPVRLYDKGVAAERPYTTFGEFHMVLREGHIVIPKVAMFEPLMQQANHFIRCVRERCLPVCDGRKGLAVVSVLEAALESLKNRGSIISVRPMDTAL
jgi:predicted dehydrogenase